jgi:hypothetical protein
MPGRHRNNRNPQADLRPGCRAIPYLPFKEMEHVFPPVKQKPILSELMHYQIKTPLTSNSFLPLQFIWGGKADRKKIPSLPFILACRPSVSLDAAIPSGFVRAMNYIRGKANLQN